eukprot:PhF_6_TR10023/c0_g1_i1/m.15345
MHSIQTVRYWCTVVLLLLYDNGNNLFFAHTQITQQQQPFGLQDYQTVRPTTSPATSLYLLRLPHFNKLIFYNSFEMKGCDGVHVTWYTSSSNVPTTTLPTFLIRTSEFQNSYRFDIIGNNTHILTIRAKPDVYAGDIYDILSVIQNVSLSGVVPCPTTRSYAVVRWQTSWYGFTWCQDCDRFVGVRSDNPYNYQDISRYTTKTEFRVNDFGGSSGLVIRNGYENDFLVANNLSGMVCGKYNVEREQWEWGCYPVAGDRMNYTNWDVNEPSYSNSSACVFVNGMTGKWRVVDCENHKQEEDAPPHPTLWQVFVKPAGGPIVGYITYGDAFEGVPP